MGNTEIMRITKKIWGAHLFVPANNSGFIEKLPFINVQNAILDLEWATNYEKKLEGRCFVKYAIKHLRSNNPNLNIAVRINTPSTNKIFVDDLKEIIISEPDIIRIPSVTSKDEVAIAAEIFNNHKERRNKELGTKLHVMIENPKGFENITEIASASEYIEAICLGGEDWVTNLGMERKKDSRELEFIRSHLVSIAARHSLLAVDSVYPWLDDYDGLKKDSEYSRNIGFVARAIQNPRQIKIVSEIYKPSIEKQEWAKQLLDNLEIVLDNKTKLFVSEGKIIDPVAVEQAKIVNSY